MSDTKTVSGNIVHIQDKGAPTALSVIVNINPKQSGSGTPSPDNVRPISGWESVSVMVSPTEDEADATTTSVNLGRTVYGGTLDVVSGVLTVDRAMVDLGTLNWGYVPASGQERFLTSGIKSTVAKPPTSGTPVNAIASQYEVKSLYGALQADGTLAVYPDGDMIVRDSRYTDAASFKAAMSGVQLCYELATPQTYTLTGQNVNLLKDCYAWADSGDISITYETYLINGLFHKIWINGVKMFAPNDFTLERSDVYAGEITTCTGKTIADRIGWKYADMSLNWDYLPQEYLETILNLSGVFTITFENEEGVQFTEQCIRKGSTMTGTRFTDVHGNMMWKGVQFDISFINVHN